MISRHPIARCSELAPPLPLPPTPLPPPPGAACAAPRPCTLGSATQRAAPATPHVPLAAIARREVKRQAVRRPIEYLRQYAALEGPDYPQECREHFHGLPYFAGVNASWQAPVCEPQVRCAALQYWIEHG